MLELVQGEDIEFEIKLEDESQDAYDLTAATEITFSVKKADGTTLSKTLSSGAISIVNSLPVNGKIKVALTDTDTNLLKASADQDMELLIDEGTNRKIVQFLKQLKVNKRVS